MKHYKLTEEFKINSSGVKLFRIECIKDFKYASKGYKGGWIEKESNLSDSAWVSGYAEVFGNSKVYGDAEVFDTAKVFGNSKISGNARVFDNAWISGNAEVFGDAKVYGDARVFGNAISTKKVFTLNFKHHLTLTDNHIRYGCEQKTVEEWEKWLDSDDEFETKRSDDSFKIIEMALKLAMEQHRQINKRL